MDGGIDVEAPCVYMSFVPMKKFGGIIVAALCLILGLIYFVTRTPKDQPEANGSGISQTDSDSSQSGDHSSSRVRTRVRTATPGDASLGSDPRNEVFTQQGAEFERGDMQNVVVTTEGMQMGDTRTFISRVNPNYKLFGVYVSQEEFVSQSFDTIVPTMNVAPGANSEVTLEVRTRPIDSEWTVWEEVTKENLGQPITLGMTAAVWQYRLTFYANDSASSAKVQKVTIATRKSGDGSLAASPNDLTVNNGQ